MTPFNLRYIQTSLDIVQQKEHLSEFITELTSNQINSSNRVHATCKTKIINKHTDYQ